MSKSKLKKPIATPPMMEKGRAVLFDSLEAWLADRRKLVLGLIVTISVLFRVSYFVQLNNGPCIWQHRFEESDMHFYDEWAKVIAHGDWLTNRSLHQFVEAYQWIADYYFKTHPDEAVKMHKQLGANQSPDAMARLLWQRWDGGKIFHQDPLYIYIVAVIYKTFGEDVRYVFILQMLIGICSILLIYQITNRYFGNLAAAIAGMMAVCCGPLMFYELVLVRETFIVFAGLLLVYLMDKAWEKTSFPKMVLLGIVTSLCILLKSIFFLFLVLTLLLLFITFKKDLKLFFLYVTCYLAGALIAYSPLLIRNTIVGAPLFSQNSIGALTAIAANDVNYNPDLSYAINIQHTAEIMSETDGKTLPALIKAIKTHPNLLSYLKLEFKKLKLVFHWYEFPNNKNFYYYRLNAPILWITFVNLLIIAPLALGGIVVAILKRKKLWSLYLLLLMHLVLLVAFLVFSRYRIPLEAAMIPFAGFALTEIIKYIQINIKYAVIMISGVILFGCWVGRPIPESITFIRGMDYQQPFLFYYQPILEDLQRKGDYSGALKKMEQVLQLEPVEVKRINSASTSLNSYELTLVNVFGNFHSYYANLLKKKGDVQEAQIQEERSKELLTLYSLNDPSLSLANLLRKASLLPVDQQPAMYQLILETASNDRKINPGKLENYFALSEAYTSLNQPDSAIAALIQLLLIDKNNYDATFKLGTLYGRYKNDMTSALIYLEKARSIDSTQEGVFVNLGIVYDVLQKKEKAIEMMYKASEINPENANSLINLERMLRTMGRTKEADEVKKKIPEK